MSVTQSNVPHVRFDEKPVKQNRGKLSYYSSCVSRELWISVSSDLIELEDTQEYGRYVRVENITRELKSFVCSTLFPLKSTIWNPEQNELLVIAAFYVRNSSPMALHYSNRKL